MFVSRLGEQGRGAGSFPGAVTPNPTLLSHLLSVTQTLGWGCERCQGWAVVGCMPLVGAGAQGGPAYTQSSF